MTMIMAMVTAIATGSCPNPIEDPLTRFADPFFFKKILCDTLENRMNTSCRLEILGVRDGNGSRKKCHNDFKNHSLIRVYGIGINV